MTGVVWKVTQYGVEADGFEIDNDRCAQIKKGRYAAIKEVCSRFYGDENDLGFIRAWRECMMWQGLTIDEEIFAITVKECSRMKSHRFVYEVARNALSPWAEPLDTPGYFQRRFNPENEDIESKTIAILKTPTPDRKGNKPTPAYVAGHCAA
jgi:hypothetical protein